MGQSKHDEIAKYLARKHKTEYNKGQTLISKLKYLGEKGPEPFF